MGSHSPVPMVAVQEARHIVRYANPAFCRLAGKSGEKIVGHPFVEVAPDNGRSLALLDRVYRTAEPETLTDREGESAGSAFWSYSIWPVKMTDERTTGIVVEMTDTPEFHRQAVEMNQALMLGNLRQHELTEEGEKLNARLREEIRERKQTEEALRETERKLRELSHSLEERVEARTRELVEQRTRLRRLATELVSAEQRERKDLAALLHDDLQQLLVAATMELDRAKSRTQQEGNESAIERAANWVGEATRAARTLTSQLRPPALYEEGFVAALHWLGSQTWERHRVRVTIDGEKPTRPISDEFNALLFDCVRELLLNIVKHAGVKEATVSVREEGDRLRVSVRDKGEGFDVEATGRAQSSSGFGLFSIHERLMALGGNTSIETAPGKGTVVRLEVPLAIAALDRPDGRPAVASPAVSDEERHPADPRPVRIVVVDDHAMVRQGLSTMIDEDERMSVVGEAADGVEAIEAMETHSPDVILIDVNMPRMNGIEATREICRRSPGTVVIGLSVQDDETTANLMQKPGAKAFLSKGGSADRMIATIVELRANQAGSPGPREKFREPDSQEIV